MCNAMKYGVSGREHSRRDMVCIQCIVQVETRTDVQNHLASHNLNNRLKDDS